MKLAKDNEVLYHIGVSRNMIKSAKFAILLDNRGYVEPIAKILQKKPAYIGENREYLTYLCDFEGVKVAVISTGFGAPAMGIGLEEMGMVGLTHFIRIGETEAVQDYISNTGRFILPTASMRMDGVSRHYAPLIYPASANIEMTLIMENALKQSGLPYHMGIVASYDAYYPLKSGDDRYSVNNSCSLSNLKKLGILGIDNELSCFFTMCNVFGFKAAALMDTVIRQHYSDDREFANFTQRIENWSKVLPSALSGMIKQ